MAITHTHTDAGTWNPKARDEIVSKESLKAWNAKGYGRGPRYTFSTYPERLEKAGIEYDPRYVFG